VYCSNCNAPLPESAGFCRGCGTILRGRKAGATALPAGYQGATATLVGRAVVPTATPAAWSGGTPFPTARDMQRARYRQRLHVLDVFAWLAAGAVIGSLFMPWYQLSLTRDGETASVSFTALGVHTGGWRWALLVVAAAIMAEGLLAGVTRVYQTRAWPHSGIQFALASTLLALVLVAWWDSPIPEIFAFAPGLTRGGAAGTYLAVGGAGCAVLAGVGRFFATPSY
jgi:hypothetical protein